MLVVRVVIQRFLQKLSLDKTYQHDVVIGFIVGFIVFLVASSSFIIYHKHVVEAIIFGLVFPFGIMGIILGAYWSETGDSTRSYPCFVGVGIGEGLACLLGLAFLTIRLFF